MKKNFGIIFGFFGLAMLDSIFSYLTPIDFTYTHFSIAWHFYLTGLLVFVRDKPMMNRFLIGAMAGIIRDMFFTSTFPFSFLFYPLIALAAGVYQNKARSLESACMIYISLIFCADLFPFLFQKLIGQTTVSFVSWFYHVELLTLLVGGLVVIMMTYIDIVMDYFYLFQSRVIKKSQRGHRHPKRELAASMNHPQTDNRKRRFR